MSDTVVLAPKNAGTRNANFLPIPLQPGALERLENTTQRTYYKLQFKDGKPSCHRLAMNAENKPVILDPHGKRVPSRQMAHVYSFVVVQDPRTKKLELRLGLGAHVFTAAEAPFVYAAGDIHIKNGDINKITNQSGSYHSTDPTVLASAKTAMQCAGLPMDKFEPFNPYTQKLLFSKTFGQKPGHFAKPSAPTPSNNFKSTHIRP